MKTDRLKALGLFGIAWTLLAFTLDCDSGGATDNDGPRNGGGTWSAAAPVPERVQELHGATLKGKIYIAGGFDSTGTPTGTAFRYDPAADAWQRITDLPEPRHHMPLVVVNDSLYAVGGLSGLTFQGESNLWLYREDLDAWEARASLPLGRGASGVGVVSDKIVVVGGLGPDRELVEPTAVYDPTTDSWVDTAPIPTPRDHLTAAVVNGILYAIAGRPRDPDRNFDVVEAFDLNTGEWSARASMPSRRGGLAAAVLNGRIHTLGGETSTSVFNNHEVYDPAPDSWSSAPPLPTARHGLAAAAVGGKLYAIAGGPNAGLAQTDVVEVFTP